MNREKEEKKADWKQLEVLVERLHRAFHPQAVVVRNDRITGRDSGRSREIDVSIRYKLGATELLIIVDCKRRSRKVDLPGIHSFIGLKSDVGAHAGIIVCDKGFSKPAMRIAKHNNVQLFTLVDTQRLDWQCRLKVPLFVEEWTLVPTIFRLIRKDGSILDITDDRTVSLTDPKTGNDTIPASVINRLWNEHPDKTPGHVCYDIAAGEDELLQDKLRIGFEARVTRYTRWGLLALTGLTDVGSKLTYTDELKVQTTAEPELVHADGSLFPPVSGWSIGVLLKTTAVKTVKLQQSGLNLKKNQIDLALKGSTKPVQIRLAD